MTAGDILAAARADGVRMRVEPNGLCLSGNRAAVARWAAAIRPLREDLVALLSPDPRVDELRQLLTLLLWDDPQGVEPEIQRTLADHALDEALVMYRQLAADYTRLGELPTPSKSLRGSGHG